MTSRRASGKVGLAAVLVVLAAACTAETTPATTGTTVGTTSSTIPALTAEGLAQLRARALQRSLADFGGYRPCISTDIPPELRAALEAFDPPVEFYEPGEFPRDSSGQYRCHVLTLLETEWPAPGVVRISAGVIRGYLNGTGKWYYFRWEGTAWVDAEPDPGDVTGQTSWAS